MNLLEVLEPVAASGMFAASWLMIAAPALGAAILLLAGRVADAWGHWLAVLAVWFSFAVAAWLFAQQLLGPVDARAQEAHLYTWFTIGEWRFDIGLLVDPLSILFALLITGVGGLIHLYLGWIQGELDVDRGRLERHAIALLEATGPMSSRG